MKPATELLCLSSSVAVTRRISSLFISVSVLFMVCRLPAPFYHADSDIQFVVFGGLWRRLLWDFVGFRLNRF